MRKIFTEIDEKIFGEPVKRKQGNGYVYSADGGDNCFKYVEDGKVEQGAQMFDTYEEADWLMRDAAIEFGHKPLPKSYDAGIHNQIWKLISKHKASIEWQDSTSVLIYFE